MAAPGRQPPLLLAVAATLGVAVLAAYVWLQVQAPAPAPSAGRPAEAGSRPPPIAEAPRASEPVSRPSVPPSRERGLVMRDQRIHDEQGRLVFEGDVDLAPVFARIEAGDHDTHRNDGTTFANREGRLPRQPRGYYTEWVVRTDGVRGVGPQRLITGRNGDAYYTPDHYETFVRVRPPS